MDPYERTSEEMRRQSEGPKRFVKKAVGVGATIGAAAAGAASFAPMLARAAPFLSQYVPDNLAIKGLSKISPKFGKFVQDSMDNGFDFKQVKDFIGKQITESQPDAAQGAQDQRNILEQYSPDLHQAIMQLVQGGEDPLVASMKIQNSGKFSKEIRDIERDHKTTFGSIVKSIFGGGNKAQKPQGKAALQQPQQGQTQAGGNTDQALLAALEKILTM